jgi:cell division protein FtsI/penicillin-binding protein 2
MALFVLRLFYIQIIKHGYYMDQADSEYIKQFVLHAKRGEIYSLDGDTPVPLVLNETVYTVWADPTTVTDKQAVIDTLNKVAGGNTRTDFAKYLDVRNSRYQVLATKVTRTQAEMLKAEKLAGIGFDAVSQRVYPEGQLASQVLGFVNAEGKGQYGFEQANDDILRGKDGVLKTVTDVRDVPLTVGDKNVNTPAENGANVVLTIDRNIQAKAEKALADGLEKTGAKKGSVIVMDPQNGNVLAMANLPTYNPADINSVTDPAAFNNDTISNAYEPGSDIKSFTVAAGVDTGAITPESTYNNTDQIQVDDITIKNASAGKKTGIITMQDALNWSFNTGMVTIAERLGDGTSITSQSRNTIYTYFHDKFRLGQSTGIELANEARGTIIPPTDQQGNAVRYSNMTFGQGMNATMIQVAAGLGAAINGGTYHTPSIIAGTVDSDGTFTKAKPKASYENVIKASSSNTVREMIYKARQEFYAGSDKKGYYIGGKTGTSQTLENGKYVDNQTIGTYLGFGGEVDQAPRYVIMVELSGKDMNLQGGRDALPIFTDISNWMIDYLKLQPKG